MRIVTGLLVSLALFLSAPATAAQALDGEWFRVKLSADGTGFHPETELAAKGKVKTIVRYAQFVLNEGAGDGPAYSVIGYTPTESGEWDQVGGGHLVMIDAAETFAFAASFFTTTVPLPDEEGGPNLIEIEFNATAKLKFKGEELKSAQIKSLGALSFFSNESHFLFGRGKVTLTRVPVTKLPFPLIMLKSGAEPKAPLIRPAALPARPAALPATPAPAATATATESATK